MSEPEPEPLDPSVSSTSKQNGRDGKHPLSRDKVGLRAFGVGGHSGNDKLGLLLTGVRTFSLEVVHIVSMLLKGRESFVMTLQEF